MVKLPLEGVRVVSLVDNFAGPFATQMLADWGAEVIWVESRQIIAATRPRSFSGGTRGRISSTPPNREAGKRPWNRQPLANLTSRNKLSMTLDLARPEGVDVFKRLVRVSDVVIENRGPEAMEKIGIGYDVLKKIKPDIIMIRMPGFGMTGPYRGFRSWGGQLDSLAGQAYLMGYRDRDPSQTPGTVHADASGGGTAVLATLMALHYRDVTGEGQMVEVAQIEALISEFGEWVMDWTLNQHVMEKLGNRDSSAIQGCYKARGEDRWVAITISTDEEWQKFCETIGSPAWTKNEAFATAVSRYKNHDELDKLIESWTSQNDCHEMMHLLQKAGVAAGPVMNERDCLGAPHLKERGFFQELTTVDTGTYPYPGPSWKMSKASGKIRRPPALFGEHNEYVYKKIIGVSDEEYAELEKAGHIGMDFATGSKQGA